MWNVTLEYYTQLPILMSWVRLDLPLTPANAQLYDAVMVAVSQKLDRKYHTNWVLNPGPVVSKSITLSAHQQLPYNK